MSRSLYCSPDDNRIYPEKNGLLGEVVGIRRGNSAKVRGHMFLLRPRVFGPFLRSNLEKSSAFISNVVQATLYQLSVRKHPAYVIIVLQKKTSIITLPMCLPYCPQNLGGRLFHSNIFSRRYSLAPRRPQCPRSVQSRDLSVPLRRRPLNRPDLDAERALEC